MSDEFWSAEDKLATDKEINTLSEKQKRFCEEYCIDLNAAAAYERAGYHSNGAKQRAWALMKDPRIRAYIKKLKEERRQRVVLAVDDVLWMLKKAYDNAMDDEKWAPAVRAAELMGKHVGMFEEKISQDIKMQQVLSATSPQEIEDNIHDLVKLAREAERNVAQRREEPRGPLDDIKVPDNEDDEDSLPWDAPRVDPQIH